MSSGCPVCWARAKTNLGHLEVAAGVAGLIKTVLVWKMKRSRETFTSKKLNPQIALDGSRMVIPTETVAWPRGTQARVAGVSSFGLGGTNAHVIVEEAPVVPAGRARAPLAKRGWKRERCWLPEPAWKPVGATAGPEPGVHPLLGRPLRSGFVPGLLFDAEIGTETIAYLRDHRLGDRPLLPFAAFLEIAHAAGRQERGAVPFVLGEFTVLDPLFLGDGAMVVQTLVSDTRVEIASEGEAGWVKHAHGSLRRVDGATPVVDLETVRARCSDALETRARCTGGWRRRDCVTVLRFARWRRCGKAREKVLRWCGCRSTCTGRQRSMRCILCCWTDVYRQ